MRSSILKMGLFRDNTTEEREKKERRQKQRAWFAAECEKKRKAVFRAKNRHTRLKNADTTEMRVQTSSLNNIKNHHKKKNRSKLTILELSFRLFE